MSIAAILADRKNTRAALAAALVDSNTEREALRVALSIAEAKLSIAQAPVTTVAAATKIVAPRVVDTTSRDAFRAKCEAKRAAAIKFYELNPTRRTVTDAELVELGYL